MKLSTFTSEFKNFLQTEFIGALQRSRAQIKQVEKIIRTLPIESQVIDKVTLQKTEELIGHLQKLNDKIIATQYDPDINIPSGTFYFPHFCQKVEEAMRLFYTKTQTSFLGLFRKNTPTEISEELSEVSMSLEKLEHETNRREAQINQVSDYQKALENVIADSTRTGWFINIVVAITGETISFKIQKIAPEDALEQFKSIYLTD